MNFVAMYLATGALFWIAPPAGLIMCAVVTACLLDELTSRRRAITYTTPPFPKQCRLYNPHGPTPCHHPNCKCQVEFSETVEYACSCHRILGNDFYFLPKNSCIYGKCDDGRDPA